MKKYFALLTAVVSLVPFSQAQGSACGNCPKPDIAIYDAHNTVPAPADPAKAPLEEINRWVRLSTADGGMRDQLVNGDPSHACYRQLDAIAINAKQTDDPGRWKLPGGFAYETLPPAGAIQGIQFLVHGLVEGTEGNYQYTAILESATTREEIARATATFATANEAEDAARLAAQGLSPLMGKIREWQRKKREQTGKSICWKTEATPKQTKIEVGKTTEIDLLAYDCDGARGEKPLKGATLSFVNLKGGVIEPAKVVTDEKGRAKVTFKAARNPGKGIGWVTLYPATTQDGFYGDDGSFQIQIGASTSNLWRLDTQVTRSSVVTIAPGTPNPPDVLEQFVHDEVRWNASVTILMECDDTGEEFYCGEDSNLAANGSGAYMRSERRHTVGTYSTEWGSTQAQGTLITDVTSDVRPRANFTYLKADQAFLIQGSVGFQVKGTRETHIRRKMGNDYDNVSPYADMTGGDFSCSNEDPSATFSASRDLYTMSCAGTVEERRSGFKYVYKHQRISTLRRVF